MPAYSKDLAQRKGNDLLPCGIDTACEAAIRDRYQSEGLSADCITAFQALVHDYYQQQQRTLPWRGQAAPWQVLVSEVMLQQTQVERVIPKFVAFMKRFPAPEALATAALPELLGLWQGLGYNRRALNLQRAARMIVEEWGGRIPDDPLQLRQLPGIGPYTAGAIAAFAFNKPELFLETNIRAVLLHLFFADQEGVTDKQLLSVAAVVLDHLNPRDWYNALMDYGSDLKRRFPNPSRRSRQHVVQDRFEGSDRQVRGAVLRLMLTHPALTGSELQDKLQVDPKRLQQILDDMLREGFLKQQNRRFSIPSA